MVGGFLKVIRELNAIAPGLGLFQDDVEHVWREAEVCIAPLRGQRLFLTGCTAFIGKWLIDSLLWGNYAHALDVQLVILTRNPDSFLVQMPHLASNPAVSLLPGGITDFCESDLSFFDYAIHAVNQASDGSPLWAGQHMNAAALGTERLYRLAAQRNCKGVLLTSSGAVYGTTGLGGKDEGAFYEGEERGVLPLLEPRVYGETKRFLELYSTALGQMYGIRTAIARCFAFSGAHAPVNNALGSFVQDALTGQDIHIKGDGTPVRSYLYASDMTAWLLTLLVKGEHGTPYNVGSERGISLAELAKVVLGCTGSNASVNIAGAKLQGNAPTCYIPDTRKICNQFNLKEKVTLERGLCSMMAWL